MTYVTLGIFLSVCWLALKVGVLEAKVDELKRNRPKN